MLIRQSSAKHGNILPRAWNVLAAMPDQFTFHLDHGRRHPKSAYGNSPRDISSQWLKCSTNWRSSTQSIFGNSRTDAFRQCCASTEGFCFFEILLLSAGSPPLGSSDFEIGIDLRTRVRMRDADSFLRWSSYRWEYGWPSAKFKVSGDGVEQGCAYRSPLIGDHVISRDWQVLISAE